MKSIDVNKENEILLEICKFKNSSTERLCSAFASSVNLPYLLGNLQYNRLGGIAYYTLKKCDILCNLNREFRNTLTKTYQENKTQAESFLQSENYLSQLLKDVTFRYACLKGAYLVKLYPLGLRTSNDFDILINAKDISEIEKILRAAGFVQGDIKNGKIEEATRNQIVMSRMNRGETVPWVKEVNLPNQKFMEIDLNFSLDYKAKAASDLVETLLNNANQKIETTSGFLKTLNREDFLIHLCVHLFKEATTINWVKMGRDLSLYKFADIYLFIVEFFNESFAKQFMKRVTQLGLEKECYYALERTQELFNVGNSNIDAILNEMKAENIASLNHIYSPIDNKTYMFRERFTDWVFLPDRMNRLTEIKE